MISVVTSPTILPVTLDMFKQHIRVTHDAEDSIYRHYLQTAVQIVTSATNHVFLATQYDLILPCFTDQIDLRFGPIASVDLVTYYDGDDASQTLDAANYKLLTETNTSGHIESTETDGFPDTYTRTDAVTIRFTAGYATQDLIPPNARQALLMLAAHYNMHRDSVTEKSANEIPFTVRTLIDSLKIGRYALTT